MGQDIANRKIELIQWLSTLEDLSIINRLLELKNTSDQDWEDSLSEAERKSIDKGIADADQGNLQSHKVARKIYGAGL